jgi:hypothetical protein
VAAGIAFAAIFLGLTVAHLVGIVKTKKRFCIPLVIGGLCKSLFPCASPHGPITDSALVEVVGYAFRVYAHHNTTITTPYAVQSVLILLAPILFAATIYMCLGRIIIGVQGENYSMIKPRFLTKIFVAGDVFCFFVQAGGAGMLTTADTASKTELGERIILGGLILQILIFVFFIVVAVRFHCRLARALAQRSPLPWQKLLLSLYAVSVLITLRNAVRAAEYGMGSSGYLLRHEWVIFAFDGACMILVLLLSLAWYRTNVGSKQLRAISTDVETYHMISPK